MGDMFIDVKNGSRVVFDDINLYKKASGKQWCIKNTTVNGKKYTYIVTTVNGEYTTIISYLYGCNRNSFVEYTDGNMYNLRKNNVKYISRNRLRKSSAKCNTSTGLKGVYENTHEKAGTKSYAVQLSLNKKHKYYGSFKTSKEAAIVHNIECVNNNLLADELNDVGMTYEQQLIEYELIIEKYGITKTVRKSKSMQGVQKIMDKSSKYVGVSKNKRKGKWEAYIRKNGHKYYLGAHCTEDVAALAYNKKASELFGKFAKLNIIE